MYTVYNELELRLTQLFFSQGCPDWVQPDTYWFTGRKTLHISYEGRIQLGYRLSLFTIVEDTARYAGLLLAPAEGFNRGFFGPLGKKESLLCYFGPLLAIIGAQ